MSIYATLWSLKFPKHGDSFIGCEWIAVTAEGVPPHIGSPTPGCGYEDGDPYAHFLPPPVDENAECMRAVVFIKEGTQKLGQEYVNPLLVLTGKEYAGITFEELHKRICDALRGSRPRPTLQIFRPGGNSSMVMFDDGSRKEVDLNGKDDREKGT